MMKRLFLFFVAILTIIYFGCSKSTEPEEQTGTMQVKMVDASGSFDAVYIVVDSVTVHISSASEQSGWYTLNSTQATYDLLTLVNGADTVIGSAELQIGRYSQMRLYIGEGSRVVVDGTENPLIIPSGMESGLKLNIHADISAGIVYSLVLDFDVNRSIVVTSDSTYKLKPVIRTIAEAETGIISGVVGPADAEAVVWGVSSSQDTISSLPDSSGNFKLLYLEPDSYTVTVDAQAEGYNDTTITSVSVTAGQITDIGVITLSMQ